MKDHIKNRELEAKEQWKLVEQQKQNLQDKTVTVSSLYGVHIYDVPAYTDSDGDGVWDGCSPIAGAMILGYWDSYGYPDFPSQNTLIDETHIAMGTDSNGATWVWNIPSGITTVAQNHGYSNFASYNDYYVSWTDVTDEIDANRPFILSMLHGGTGSGESQPYGDHSTADVGYAIDSGTNAKYVLLHNTWDTSTHYLAFGDWWGAIETVVRP